MSDDTIFGYSWAEIQRAQQGGKLRPAPVVPQPLSIANAEDYALLKEHGSLAALVAAGFHGVVDRLARAGVK